MISGSLDPWEPLFMDLNIPNDFRNSKEQQETFLWIILLNLDLGIKMLENDGKAGTPKTNKLDNYFGGSKTIFYLYRFK